MPVIKTINKEFLLHLADNALVLGHRNSEWTGHGPVLEQDIAISNIALDLIGQARNFYQYAAILFNDEEPGTNQTEDSLAYLRDAREYRNFLCWNFQKVIGH
jgi:ring-1,2-phenylacetyl-CoA epoxidase subunit PaaC